MVKLTEDMIVARTRVSDLAGVKKLNCWGADIDDVSVLKRCQNVEMLSLSLNSIDSLSDFQHCKKLQELFLRKNHIHSLRELLWLKDLAKLKNLWLAENPCSEGNGNRYRQTVIHNLPQLEKLDNVTISSQERAEALRYGEGVGEVDPDDGDTLSNCADNRRMSIEELEDLRSEQGDNHLLAQPDLEEDYQRRYSSASGPDNQHQVYSAGDHTSGSQFQSQQQYPQYNQYQQQYQQEERSSLMQQSSALLRTGSSGRMSVSSYTQGPEMALMLDNNHRQRSAYFDDTRSSVSEYRPAPAGQFRSPGSVYSVPPSSSGYGSGSGSFRGERPSHGPDLARHAALQRPQRSRNSNILSSILCLIKEVDIPSLEVVEVAVRCRMEELED